MQRRTKRKVKENDDQVNSVQPFPLKIWMEGHKAQQVYEKSRRMSKTFGKFTKLLESALYGSRGTKGTSKKGKEKLESTGNNKYRENIPKLKTKRSKGK